MQGPVPTNSYRHLIVTAELNLRQIKCANPSGARLELKVNRIRSSAAVSAEDQPQYANPFHVRKRLPGASDLLARCGWCFAPSRAPDPQFLSYPPIGCR